MARLSVPLPDRAYDIVAEAGILDQVGSYCKSLMPRAKRIAVVTDTTVAPLYAARVNDSLADFGCEVGLSIVQAGETSKCVSVLEGLYDDFMKLGLTRTDGVIALGGGVIGDLAGFAAATILRGVDYIQVPTTLLAQVDSSVGGKVAVDLKAGKNLAGAFWQPKGVLIDPDCLASLAGETFSDGMAEVIKYGCIADADFFQLLLDCGGRDGIMDHIEEVITTCCGIKAQVVLEDERDTGRRMILNFGHTLGHAYEQAYHYEKYTHGQAVAAGMVRAAELGVRMGVTPEDVPGRIREAVRMYGLPEEIPCKREDCQAAIGLDKKGTGDDITVILLDRLGSTRPVKLSKTELLDLLGGEDEP